MSTPARGSKGKRIAPDAPSVGIVDRSSLDPITFEVLRNALASVVNDMGAMLEKVAFSTVVSEARDFSGALCTRRGELITQGEHDLPFIGGTNSSRVKAVLDLIPMKAINPGDLFIHNDSFLGGTHAQDVSVVMPVFWKNELFAFVLTSAHWPDMGGPVPGSFNSEARSTYEEALLVPPIHIVREGEHDEEVERLILRNVRTPEVAKGDLRGMIEACRTGDERLRALLARYDPDLVDEEIETLLDYAEGLLRDEFRRLPDGTYSWTDYIDFDPGAGTGEPVQVGLDVTIAGDGAIFDFSRTAPQGTGPINAPPSATRSACMVGLKSLFPHVPFNEGLLRPVELKIPERSVVGAQYPAPISGVAANAGEKVTSCIQGCFIQVIPERAMACPTSLINSCFGGYDPRPERQTEYVMYLWLEGGWGARPGKKDNHTAMIPLGSGARTQEAEVLERVYPVIIEGHSFLPDSEGAGRHRGGFGVTMPLHLTDGDATLMVQGDRGRVQGWGYAAGLAPLGNRMVYAAGTDEEEDVGVMRAGFRVKAGRSFQYWQGGGGGWGHPHDRPTEWVLEDVINELISVDRARDVYGVEIEVQDAEALAYAVDEEATQRLRSVGREQAGNEPGETARP